MLEKLLPPRPQQRLPTGENVEEVNLMPFDSAHADLGGSGRREAYHESDEEEDGGFGGMPGGPRVQCAHQ